MTGVNSSLSPMENLTGLQNITFQDNVGYRNTYDIHRIAAPELLVVDRVVTPIWYIIGIIEMTRMNSSMPIFENLTGLQNNTAEADVGYRNTYDIHRIAAPELLVVDRVVTPIWYIIGIIGNPLSIKIWLSKKVRRTNTSAIYLGSIAIVHTAFICLHIWMELLQAWAVRTINRPVLCQVFMTVYMIPQYLAPLLILGFTCERFIAVCFPFHKERFCTVKRAFVVVLSLTSLATMFSLFQGYVWTYDDQTGVCEIEHSVRLFNEVCTWVTEMLCFAVTPLAVLIINILVIREIRRINKFVPSIGTDSDKSSAQTSTFTLLSVSFYLICTLLPATIVYIIQLSIEPGNMHVHPKHWSRDPTWTTYLTYFHIRKIIEEVCFSNFASYFFIYYTTSPYFRIQVNSIFSCCSRREGSAFVSVTTNGTKYELARTSISSSPARPSQI